MSGSTVAVSSRIVSPSGRQMSSGPQNRTFVSQADPAYASQSDARVDASRQSHTVAHAATDHRRHVAFRPIEQEWDHKNPCKYCGFIWLKSSSKDLRSKCCQNGLMADLDNCPLFLVLCQEFWILECAAEILSLEPAISTILFFKWGLWVLKMTSRVVVLTI